MIKKSLPGNLAFRRSFSAVRGAVESAERLFRQIKRGLYSREVFVGLHKEVPSYLYLPPCKVDFVLQRATQKHIMEALYRAEAEKRPDVYRAIREKWFEKPGFRRCYAALTRDTGDLCCLMWVVLPHDIAEMAPGSLPRCAGLKKDECLLDDGYTFGKYRETGIMPHFLLKVAAVAGSAGFRWVKTYIPLEDLPHLIDCRRAGFQDFERQTETRVLFTARSTVLRIRPPQNPVNVLYASSSSSSVNR